jgi:2-alkyl-3-oxoalkanoate reductase
MRILVSGAAGLIGGELVARLAEAGHSVVALVHRNPEVRANDGALVPSQPWAGAGPPPGEVQTIRADVGESGAGLAPETQMVLASSVDMIIHCAALLAFDADAQTLDRVNVGGTANMLAAFPGVPFLHVSTAYVCGLKDGAIAEAPRDADYGFSNGYEASKAAAEELVYAQNDREWAIARPSIVVGAHGCGTIRNFDTIYGAFRLMAEGRIATLPTRKGASLDLVPIDHVVGALLDMVDNWQAARGRIVHLCGDQSVPIPLLLEAMAAFPQFARPTMVDAERFDPDSLASGERRMFGRITRHYAGYFTRNPQFDADALAQLSGRTCPLVDAAALERMIGFAVEMGFLRAGIVELA